MLLCNCELDKMAEVGRTFLMGVNEVVVTPVT